MKTVTNEYKNKIRSFGKEIDVVIQYYDENEHLIKIGNENINSIDLHYEGNILKSVMKQLDIDCKVEIPKGTEIRYRYGVKVRKSDFYLIDYRQDYDYIEMGYYIVNKVEKQEDTSSYLLTCYDKMLYSMVDYENSGITYPITVKNYLSAICNKMGVSLENTAISNGSQQITEELYLDNDGNSMGYTFRDVLDDLAEVTASTICINNNDNLEAKYPQDTDNNLVTSKSSFSGAGITIRYNSYDDTLTINGTTTSAINNSNFLIGNTIEITSSKKYVVGYEYISGNISSQNAYFTLTFPNAYTKNIYIVKGKQFQSYTASSTTTINSNALYHITIPQGITFTDYTIKLKVQEGMTLQDSVTITEDEIKNINANFGEKYGAINTVVLSRSNGTDKISKSIPTDLADENKYAIEIIDNQILNSNDRSNFIDGILNKVYGLNYYVCDFESTGITYLDLCDKFNVKIDNTTYNCLMLNDDINQTSGLKETIYSKMPEIAEQDYKYMNETDKTVRNAEIIINKKIGEVDIRGKTINMTADNIEIISNNFSVTDEGVITATAGKIADYTIQDGRLYNEVYTEYNYTSSDKDRLFNIISGTITPTQEDYDKYDFNNSGTLQYLDYVILTQIINYGISTTTPLIIELASAQTTSIDSAFKVRVGNNTLTNIGIRGINTNRITAGNIDCGTCILDSSTTDVRVDFNKTFSSPPNVVITPVTNASGVIAPKVKSITTTYFYATIGGSGFTNIDCNWIAIGD